MFQPYHGFCDSSELSQLILGFPLGSFCESTKDKIWIELLGNLLVKTIGKFLALTLPPWAVCCQFGLQMP